MISSCGTSQPPGNNPSYYYRASPTLPQLLWMLPETPFMFHTCNYNIRVTHRNGAIKHIFLHESDPRRDHQQIVLYSFACPCVCFLHLEGLNKIISKSSRRFTLSYTSVGCISLQNASRTALCYAKLILLSENIPNIWHNQQTKHMRLTRLKR